MTQRKTDCPDAWPADLSTLASQRPDAGRRRLLKLLGATGAVGAASSWLTPLTAVAQAVNAAPANDYKAIVCLFMFGGNDGNNTLLPYEASDYALYRKARSRLALNRDQVLPIQPTNTGGVQYALHPAMTGLQALFNAGQAAAIANVGTLVVPTTKAQWTARSVPLPAALFSHSDQQAQWQSAIYDDTGRNGWGGRLMERLVPAGSANRGYACLSVAGGNLWETGDQSVVAYKVSASGNLGFDFYKASGTDPLSAAISQTLAESRPHLMEQAWVQMMARSIEVQQVLSSAMDGADLATPFPDSGLGRQLRTIARLIRARTSLGLSRQVFFCSLGGFDTHGEDQLQRQQELLGEVSAAVSAFHAATVEIGAASQVTLFTASEFSRTLATNGQGSDHAWGNHQFVVGGAVKGNAIYGHYPNLTVGGPDDTDSGRWIPTTSTDQLGATLATWFGATPAQLPALFPGIGNFTADLGFMTGAPAPAVAPPPVAPAASAASVPEPATPAPAPSPAPAPVPAPAPAASAPEPAAPAPAPAASAPEAAPAPAASAPEPAASAASAP